MEASPPQAKLRPQAKPPGWEDLTPDDVASIADAGADWWQEYVPPRLSLAEARRRIESGPITG